MMEHPQPPIPFADPEAGLVGLQDGSRQETGADVIDLRREGFARRLQHVDESAFADFEAEDVGQQPRQTLEGDALGEAQVNDKGAQVFPERRAGLHSARRRGLELFRATGADPSMQRHTGDIGLDIGDFDVIIGFARSLRHAGNVRAAMLASGRDHIAFMRRIRMQRPVRPGMRLALGLFRRRDRGLSPLARGRARIIRRLRRQAELGFEFANTCRQKLDLPRQCRNHLRLRQNQADQRFLVQRFKRFTIHPELESAPAPLVKIVSRGNDRRTPESGGEQLQNTYPQNLNMRRCYLTFANLILCAAWH